MVDEQGVQLEPAEHLWYVRVPTNKYRGDFWSLIPQYTAEAILAWKAIRPKNQPLVQDRKTRKPTEYLFQYREKMIGKGFLNDYLIPLLCKAAGLTDEQGKPYRDAIGPITSHRARSSTAYYLKAMGMTPYDIGKLLGHTNPNRTLPWYLKENLHQLGRMYRKANPLDRTVHALLDTDAAGRGEPCVFYYLAESAEGRPRMCGNPNFRVCYHQLKCAECAAYIETEMAEVIEKRPGVLHISVPIPLPEQLQEQRPERNGTLRIVYAASMAHCRPCPLREQCQGYGASTKKPRRVSAILRPSVEPAREAEVTAPTTGTAPLLWRDWSRGPSRREWMRLLRSQRVDLLVGPKPVASPPMEPKLLSRA